MRSPPTDLRAHVFSAFCKDLTEGHTQRTDALRAVVKATRK